MANKWSLKEDCIIAKFCQECQYRIIKGERLDELMVILRQNGFDFRSKAAVSKRAKDFTILFCGGTLPVVSKQVRDVYRILGNNGYDEHLSQLQSFVFERGQEELSNEFDAFDTTQSDLTHMVHEVKGKKFIDVLEDYIKKSNIRPKSNMYKSVNMSDDTFSAIRRGKYNSVSRENIFKICFGLRLRYEDAVILVNSAGYYFRGDEILDTVVEYHLKRGPTYDSVDKYRGKEKICYIYDTAQIDIDLIESGTVELFCGFKKGDDKDDED